MDVSASEQKLVNKYLWEHERLHLIVKQSVLHHGQIPPKIIVVTDERVIIISRGIVPSKINIDSIPLADITAVKLDEGITLSTVFLRLAGTMAKEGILDALGEPEGEVRGLSKEDGRRLAEQIEKLITQKRATKPIGREAEEFIYCTKCGTKNEIMEKCRHCGAALDI